MRAPRTTLDAALVEHAAEPEAVATQLEEAVRTLALLQSDLRRRDELPERSRLARQHVQVCDLAYLLGDIESSRSHADEAIALFERDKREAPLLLAQARRARALCDADEARRILAGVLASDDLVVEAWREKLELWLAAICVAGGDYAAARACVERADAACERNPRKDRSLVDRARALLKNPAG